MKRLYYSAVAAVFAAVLSSCGGGSSSGETGNSNSQGSLDQANSIQQYVGNFNGSACEQLPDVTNLDQGGPVYSRTAHRVSALTATTGVFAYRIDFFADAQCATSALASLSNENPANRVAILGSVQLGDGVAKKVEFNIFPPTEQGTPDASSGTVVFGSTIRLSLPSYLFGNSVIRDLWQLDGAKLYEGNSNSGADGFPLGLDRMTPSIQTSVFPALPPQPCATKTLTWTDGLAQCSAQAPVSLATGQEKWLDDVKGPSKGGASFTCINGQWSAPKSSYCIDSTPQPPPCAEQTWTWTVNGNTCKGTIPAGYTSATADNVVPGLMGSKSFTCTASPTGGFQWSEFVFGSTAPSVTVENCEVVVVTPPLTDPLAILKANNCMVCHTVTTPSFGFFPSFQEIAAHYRSNPPAQGILETKIKQGGLGVFVSFPMPANPQISDRELAIVVPWILSQ